MSRLFKLVPFLLGMLVILVLNRLEHYTAPVIKDFVIEKMDRTPEGIVMLGSMRKVRDCGFVGLSARSQTGIELGVQFLDLPVHNSTRPTGSQDWGPWRIYLPITPSVTTIQLHSIHECHPFWSSRTTLLTLPIAKDSE